MLTLLRLFPAQDPFIYKMNYKTGFTKIIMKPLVSFYQNNDI